MNNVKNIQVILYVGLPGSGKTTFLLSKKDGYFIDDFCVNSNKIEDFKLTKYNKLYIADPMLCSVKKEIVENKIKELLKSDNIQFEWFFYENDVDACINNVKSRSDGRQVSENFIMRLSMQYEENHNKNFLKAIPVYKEAKNV